MARVTSVASIERGVAGDPPAEPPRRPVLPDVCASRCETFEQARNGTPADVSRGAQARPVRQPEQFVGRRQLAAGEQAEPTAMRTLHESHHCPSLIGVRVKHPEAFDEQLSEDRRASRRQRHCAERVEQRCEGIAIGDPVEPPVGVKQRGVRRFDVAHQHLHPRLAQLNPGSNLGIRVHAQRQCEVADVGRFSEARGTDQFVCPVEQREKQPTREDAPASALGNKEAHGLFEEFPFADLLAGAPARQCAEAGDTAQRDLAQNLRIGEPRAVDRCQRFEERANVFGVTVKGELMEFLRRRRCRIHAPRLPIGTGLTHETAEETWFTQDRSRWLPSAGWQPVRLYDNRKSLAAGECGPAREDQIAPRTKW